MAQISSGTVNGLYNLIQPLVSNLLPNPTASSIISMIIGVVVFAIALSIFFSLFAYIFGWLERKMIARAQSRHGPTYVGTWGILQNLADLIKLVTKENIIPAEADKPLFQMTIPMMVATFVVMLAFIPFTSNFVAINSSLSLVVVFLLVALVPLLVFLAGWTSGNKFGSIAAQRSVVMLLSYEIPLILVVATAAMLAGGFSLASIVAAQQSSTWYVILMPIGAVLFFIVMLAETERPPFDIREADSELIAGWLTDVSAPYYSLVLLLDYIRMLAGVLLIVVLFFGGWIGPSFLPPFAWLLIKVVIFTVFIIVVRATTVRMRLDRLIKFGWVYMMPLAVLNLMLTFVLFIK
jgi:NADH-quinone oxidoreductase subunit H